MPYLQTEVSAGPYIFTYKGFALRYRKKYPRGPNINKCSHEQQRRNDYYARRNRIWKIAENFTSGDLWVTCTYKPNKRPEDMKFAQKDRNKFLRRIRDECNKHGIPFVYMGMTERGVRGAVHHHFIIRRGVDEGIIYKAWKEYGSIKISEIGSGDEIDFSALTFDDDKTEHDDDIIKLAKYFVKGDSDKSEKTFTQSRNLRKPKIKKRIIRAERWVSKPKPKKGYEIQSIYDGFHDFSGYPYQDYIQVRRC